MIAGAVNPLNKITIQENFLNGSTGLAFGLTTSNVGTGTSNTSKNVNGMFGVTIIKTGAGVTGSDRGGHTTSLSTGRLGGKAVYMKMVLTPDTGVPDGTNTGFLSCGLGDVISSEPSNGVYLWSANGETWKLKTAVGGVRTTYDTALTPTIGTYITVEAWINQALTAVVWAVNGAVVSTSTTNLPANSTNLGLRTVACRTSISATDQGLAIDELTLATW